MISRFELTQGLTQILESQHLSVQDYQASISKYHSTGDKAYKKTLKTQLASIKSNLTAELVKDNPLNARIKQIESQIQSQTQNLNSEFDLFDIDAKTKAKNDAIIDRNIQKLQKELAPLLDSKAALESTHIYNHSIEWRFEFPQVLDSQGSFVGFDLVIANPPYIGEKNNKHVFQSIGLTKFGQRFYQGKMDLFYFFFHLGLDLLRDGGILHYITTSYYITATGAAKLRDDICTRSDILQMLNFGELRVFESAAGQHNLLICVFGLLFLEYIWTAHLEYFDHMLGLVYLLFPVLQRYFFDVRYC